MRTDIEQIDGLMIVQDLVVKRAAPSQVIMSDEALLLPWIRILAGDVPALVGTNGVEVVYAVGGYDVWIDGHLTVGDASAEVAAHHLHPGGRLPDNYRKP